MLKVTGVGRITVKPEIKETNNGTKLCEFSIACNDKNDNVNFISIICFNKQAENIVKFLGKGSKIAVSGNLEIENYERKDGSKGKNIKVINPDVIEFLDSSKGE